MIFQCSCTVCANFGYGELNEKRPLTLCVAERQHILRGTLNLRRQPKAMSREKASAGRALSSVVNYRRDEIISFLSLLRNVYAFECQHGC